MDNKRWEYQKTNYKKENNPNYRGGKEVPCGYCEELIYRRPYDLKRSKNHFCSSKCHDDFRRKPKKSVVSMKGEDHPRWNGKRHCKICGKELLERRARQVLICSQKCSVESKKKGVKQAKITRYGESGGWGEYICNRCGKVVRAKASIVSKRQFCSSKCAMLSGVNLKHIGPTKLELAVAKALDDLALEYITEHSPKDAPGRYDFYISDLNLLIEADGEFWHYSDWAKENTDIVERDARKTEWAKENGYQLIRLKEMDVLEKGAIELLEKIIFGGNFGYAGDK